MLVEERFREIQKYVESHGTVTVQELTDLLNTSESTVRRDLTELHKRGTLIKVHGGATTVGTSVRTRDEELSVRRDRNTEEKHKIAVYAAELIEADDFVYLDAGTTTACMIPYITEKTATFVTNAVSHALELAGKGFVRTHAAYIVALRYCRKFEKNDIVLEGDVKVPVSRERRQMAKEQFMISRRR